MVFRRTPNQRKAYTYWPSNSAGVAEANLINRVEPEYPQAAKDARIQGTLEFSVVIGEDGSVKSMSLVRGHPIFVKAAKQAIEQWRSPKPE